MIRKRLTISVVVAVLVLSVVGSGAVTTGVLADSQADGDDSRESATAMATNSTETGALESEDVDWYAFDVEAGERIWGHLELGSNDSIINENKSARFDIFGPSGDNVNEYPIDMMGPAYRPNAGATMQALGGTMAEQSGTYYIRVKGTNITEYDLTIETQRLDGHDPNEQPATATPIESGETLSAVMSGPDRDTYAIDLEKGETIDVTASDVGSNLVNTQLLGPNASDATINGHHNEHVVTDEPPWATQLNHTANTSGTYFIHVYPFEEGIGLYDMEDRYELSVTVSGDDSDEQPSDDDNSRTNATELSVGTPGNGSIDSKTDADWYAIDLQEGQGFTAELTHMNREDPSTSIEFDVFGPDGDEIGEVWFDRPLAAYRTSPGTNTGVGGDVVEQTGTHYLRIQGERNTTGANYSLTVNTDELDEHDPNELPATATSIESGETVSGVLTGYDRDLYAIDLEQGETVSISGTATGGSIWVANSSVPNPVVNEYSFEHSEIDGTNLDASYSFTANQTDTYYIKIVTHPDVSTLGSFFETDSYEMQINVSSESTDPQDDESETDSEPSETPSNTDDTEQSDSEETVDDVGDDTGDTDEIPTNTDDTEQSDPEESVDDIGDDADASEQLEC